MHVIQCESGALDNVSTGRSAVKGNTTCLFCLACQDQLRLENKDKKEEIVVNYRVLADH